MKYKIVESEYSKPLLKELIRKFFKPREPKFDRLYLIADSISKDLPYLDKSSEVSFQLWDHLREYKKIGSTSLKEEICANSEVFVFFDRNYYYTRRNPILIDGINVTMQVLQVEGEEIRNNWNAFPEDCYFVNTTLDQLWIKTHEYTGNGRSNICFTISS